MTKKRIPILMLICALSFTGACGRTTAGELPTTAETFGLTAAVSQEPTATNTEAFSPKPTDMPAQEDVSLLTDSLDAEGEPERPDIPAPSYAPEPTAKPMPTNALEPGAVEAGEGEKLTWNEEWEFASHSEIHSGEPSFYRSDTEHRKGIVVAVNAGHGTKGGSSVKTLCHPDGTAKVTGGSTAAGATYATAVSFGTTFLDGTPEAEANLSLALLLKDMLLEEGYDVLMIRESDDQQLDNIARTVYANTYADCHIALHYDSTESDKGFFFIGVPNVASYRAMEPVASHWEMHNQLGWALVEGMKTKNIKICGDGNIPLDLTQTSYSTIPSVDVEVGDRKSDYSKETQIKIAEGLVIGLNIFFGDR